MNSIELSKFELHLKKEYEIVSKKSSQTLGILTSIFLFDNKIFMISMLSFSTAINNGVLLNIVLSNIIEFE